MSCVHRIWLAHCTRCQVRASLRKHIPPPCSEQERVARKLLAERAAELRAREDDGEALEPGDAA